MKECSKSIPRRNREPNFSRKYFCGNGVDIGGKPDPLVLYSEFFPFVQSIRTWDLEDGDAQFMAGVTDGAFDFAHSSHCLEHLADPYEGLRSWFRIIRPGGYLVVTVPDEDLYEQGVFPSTFNRDHKWTFTIDKTKSWSEKSINLMELLASLGPEARVEKIELLTDSYRFGLPRYDQTLTPVGECGIEFIVRKATAKEVETGLRERSGVQPGHETRVHLNQYRNDHRTMKETNKFDPPFTNDGDL